MNWLEAIGARIGPTSTAPDLGQAGRVAILLGIAVTVSPQLWRVLRVGVTLVHEFGHALVGILAGRRFTGFVVRGDMSGHAVTVGPRRGTGRVMTTWAGYPAPAIVGALMIWAAAHGWAAPLLTAVLVVLISALPRTRSFETLAVVVVVGAGTGALWWWGSDQRQAQVVSAAGVVLLLGAWRHLGTLVTTHCHDPKSDPAALARLTGMPRALWVGTFVLVMALATWLAAGTILGR